MAELIGHYYGAPDAPFLPRKKIGNSSLLQSGTILGIIFNLLLDNSAAFLNGHYFSAPLACIYENSALFMLLESGTKSVPQKGIGLRTTPVWCHSFIWVRDRHFDWGALGLIVQISSEGPVVTHSYALISSYIPILIWKLLHWSYVWRSGWRSGARQILERFNSAIFYWITRSSKPGIVPKCV